MFKKLFGQRAATVDLDMPRCDLSIINAIKDDEFVDMDVLTAALGIGLEIHPYKPELCGTLQRYGKQWVIGISRADSFVRQRFTIAHEIGHYVMHRDLVAMREGTPGVADSRRYHQPDIPALANHHVLEEHERQANRIAIMILMSEPKMRRLMDEGLPAEHIATMIGCSVEATRIRVEGLAGVPAKG